MFFLTFFKTKQKECTCLLSLWKHNKCRNGTQQHRKQQYSQSSQPSFASVMLLDVQHPVFFHDVFASIIIRTQISKMFVRSKQ